MSLLDILLWLAVLWLVCKALAAALRGAEKVGEVAGPTARSLVTHLLDFTQAIGSRVGRIAASVWEESLSAPATSPIVAFTAAWFTFLAVLILLSK